MNLYTFRLAYTGGENKELFKKFLDDIAGKISQVVGAALLCVSILSGHG